MSHRRQQTKTVWKRFVRSLRLFAVCHISLLLCHLALAAPRDTQPDTWSAVDALGRAVPVSGDVRSVRADRFVAMHYYMSLQPASKNHIYDITQIRAASPDHPRWGPVGAPHWWAAPQFGYYASDDPWVIRKHAQQLSDAGVDVIVLDVSAGQTYDDTLTAIGDTFEKIRGEGGRTPQIAFMVGADAATVIAHLFDTVYAAKRYPDLWFTWLGKPLLLGPTDGLPPAISAFFTFRSTGVWTARKSWFGDGHDRWPWLDNTPQKFGWHDLLTSPEEIAVGVAQFPLNGIGRSFHDGSEPREGDRLPDAGAYFAEQWTRALAVDAPIVFVSGWNQWISPRYVSNANGPPMMAGRPLPVGGSFFVDEYSDEFSRDIEPMFSGHGDNYYYQLVSAIRQYKGVRPRPEASKAKTILIAGSFAQWKEVTPVYLDDVYDTEPRDHCGFDSSMQYLNDSGRNDLAEMRVARDADNVYFYVQTRNPLTTPEGQDWMTLLISTQSQFEADRPSWQGYDLLIDRTRPADGSCSIERCTGGWNWLPVGNATLRFEGNQLQLSVPRSLLNRPNEPLEFNFKWADHATGSGRAADFLDHGDVAPNGRFNYRYRE